MFPFNPVYPPSTFGADAGGAMTCPNCELLRAQLADAERHVEALQTRLAELTGGDPDPVMVAASATIARLRLQIAEMTRWRTGEPPARSWVWREKDGYPPDGVPSPSR